MSSPTPGYFKVITNLFEPARCCGRFDETDAKMTRTGKGTGTLVILLHGFASRPDDLRTLVPVIDKAYGEPDIFAPGLPMHFFSFHEPLALCRNLLEQIDALYEKHRYERIVLVGHSFGSLIARKLVVCAFGNSPEAPLEEGLGIDQERPWGDSINRVILLAGMNRGWSISRHLSVANMVVWHFGIVLGYLLAILRIPWRLPLIFKVRRGTNFITQLRLQWLALRKRERAGSAPGTESL